MIMSEIVFAYVWQRGSKMQSEDRSENKERKGKVLDFIRAVISSRLSLRKIFH